MEYVLDVAKWRCGGTGPNQLGRGDTSMLNEKGYMCCLGQFAKNRGITDKQLLNFGTPEAVSKTIRNRYDTLFIDKDGDNTELAEGFIRINDNFDTTPQHKIERINTRLIEYGHTLKVINEEIL